MECRDTQHLRSLAEPLWRADLKEASNQQCPSIQRCLIGPNRHAPLERPSIIKYHGRPEQAGRAFYKARRPQECLASRVPNVLGELLNEHTDLMKVTLVPRRPNIAVRHPAEPKRHTDPQEARRNLDLIWTPGAQTDREEQQGTPT